MDTTRERHAQYAWLMYYNDYLYRANVITHEEWRKMVGLICAKYG